MSQPKTQDEFPSLDQLEAQFARLAATADAARLPRSPAWRPSGGTAVAVVASLAVIGAAFLTPPGRSAAEAVGRLVGIGDEPTLGVGEDQRAVVIGTGDDAERFRYEVVARSQAPETCVFVEFPALVREAGAPTVGQCLTATTRADLDHESVSVVTYRAPKGLPPDANTLVQGLALPQVAQISMAYERDGQPVEVPISISTLDGELARSIGTSDETQFFVAFLPPGVASSDVDISGRNGSGAEVFRAHLGDLAHALPLGPGGTVPQSG
jgi:hypothetical protein